MKKFATAFILFLLVLNLSCASTTKARLGEPPYPTPVVLLYTAEGCWWCVEAEKFLKDNDIEYVQKDLEDPEEFKRLQHIAKKLDYKGGLQVVPLFVVGQHIIRGFDPVEVVYCLEKSKWLEPRWDSLF